MTPTAQARRNMVDGQLRTFDVSDRALLAAMDELPRELFVPSGRESVAYFDQNLLLSGEGDDEDPRAMLAPMVLARLIQELDIEAGTRVLDVGSGLGYSSAILARIGAKVTSLESRPDLAAGARDRLSRVGLSNAVRQQVGKLGEGAPDDAPFDAILVNGAVEVRPDRLLHQLADGGRLACLARDGRACRAVIHVRSGEAFGHRALFDASAPLLSAFAQAPAFAF